MTTILKITFTDNQENGTLNLDKEIFVEESSGAAVYLAASIFELVDRVGECIHDGERFLFVDLHELGTEAAKIVDGNFYEE